MNVRRSLVGDDGVPHFVAGGRLEPGKVLARRRDLPRFQQGHALLVEACVLAEFRSKRFLIHEERLEGFVEVDLGVAPDVEPHEILVSGPESEPAASLHERVCLASLSSEMREQVGPSTVKPRLNCVPPTRMRQTLSASKSSFFCWA